MSKIKVLALGGLAEYGKNLYVVEVEEDIIVLDCGSMSAGEDLPGVDSVIPDFTYLKENESRIKGIFLTNPNHENVGSVHELIKEINVPIYCSRFTSLVLFDKFKEEKLLSKKKNVKIVKDNSVVKISKTLKVSAYQISYSLPETLSYCIHTEDGVIVYAAEYNLKPKFNSLYKTNYSKLTSIAKEGVLLYLGESVGCTISDNSESDSLLNHHLKEVFKLDRRLIFTIYSNDFTKIQRIIDYCVEYNKKIALIGRKAQRMLDIGINEGYVNIPQDLLLNLKYLDYKNKNYSKDMVVLVTGENHEPYYMLQRIAKKKDKLINLHKDDLVMLLTVPKPGVEKMATNTKDILYKQNAKVIELNKKILVGNHASISNTLQMYSFLTPKYIMPIAGEYRHQFAQKGLAKNVGYTDDEIVIGKNGEVFTFIDGELQDSVYEVFASEVLVDGALVGDVNAVVLRDREILSEDGLIMMIINIDARKKVLKNKTEIISDGFITSKEQEELFGEITEIFENKIKEHFTNKFVDWTVLKTETKDAVSSHIFKKLRRRTLVIPTIIDTQLKGEK